ncbi:MAG: DUF4912 domain-containing protein [Firmicutes bacterium]|nr:DUF4912 domain-containing protein [Bacillota bacterium]
MRELTTEGQSPQEGNTAETPTAEMESASPPTSDIWKDQSLHEDLPTPACPIAYQEVPTRYGEDYVVLLPRDPAWIFAYWEITPQAWSETKGGLHDHECQTVLRVYELDHEKHEPQGHFDILVHPFSQAWHIQTGKLGGVFQAAIGIRTPKGTFREITRSNIVTTPRGNISPKVDEQWLTVEEFYWLSHYQQPGHSPMKWQERREGRITALGAYPTSPGVFSPMAGFGVVLPTEQALEKQPFFLEVQTELILHGQTTPGAMVTVGGEAIALRPDGSFSLRFALPDGTFCLPVRAIAPDKQEQIITPLVSRQTQTSIGSH